MKGFFWALSFLLLLNADPARAQESFVSCGIASGFPPYQFVLAGEPAGFDVDVARAVCVRLGLQISFAQAEWENVLNMLDSDWGSLRQVNFPYRASLVNVTCLQANGAPVTGAGQACAKYEYSSFRAPSETIYTNYSIWQVRLGVRLDFRGL